MPCQVSVASGRGYGYSGGIGGRRKNGRECGRGRRTKVKWRGTQRDKSRYIVKWVVVLNGVAVLLADSWVDNPMGTNQDQQIGNSIKFRYLLSPTGVRLRTNLGG